MTLTADYGIQVHDLRTHRHEVLARVAELLGRIRAQVYAFDDTDHRTVDGFVQQARAHARILADEGEAAVELPVWVIADPRDDFFGRVVPAETMENDELCVVFGNKGVADFDGDLRWVQLMDQSEVEDFIPIRRKDHRDDRLLGLHADASGRRSLSLTTAVPMVKSNYPAGWSHQGPSAALEFVQSVASAYGGLVQYDSEWARSSGVLEGSATRHEHRIRCETLRLGIEYDQRDITNNASDERLVRRLIQVEAAVSRNPTHPDYGGLGLVLARPVSEGGAAHTTRFTERVAERQKAQSQVMKQARMEKEGKDALRRASSKEKRQGKGGGRGGGAAEDA